MATQSSVAKLFHASRKIQALLTNLQHHYTPQLHIWSCCQPAQWQLFQRSLITPYVVQVPTHPLGWRGYHGGHSMENSTIPLPRVFSLSCIAKTLSCTTKTQCQPVCSRTCCQYKSLLALWPGFWHFCPKWEFLRPFVLKRQIDVWQSV